MGKPREAVDWILYEVDRLEKSWREAEDPSTRLRALDDALASRREVTLSGYQIHRRIGVGGMGSVYEGFDEKTNRKIALKVFSPKTASSTAEARFSWEAEVTAKLDHPNIVEIYSVERSEGLHFITMELVEGRKLTDLIPRVGMGTGQFFDLALPLVRATEAAHARRLVHRDLKPDNIMVTHDGRLTVLDFGIVKSADPFLGGELERPARLTQADQIVGTIEYMSPEQANAQAVDERSDVFSLGIVFYEMLTGQNPFARESIALTLASLLRDVPAPLSTLRDDLPTAVDEVVMRCLNKKPDSRFRNASELRQALEYSYLGRGLTPLVGRRAELEALEEAHRLACGGELQTVVLAGNAGLGKTRLLQEFTERKSRAKGAILHGYSESSGTTAPLQPFMQMLRRLFGVSERDARKDAEVRISKKLDQLGLTDWHAQTVFSLLSAGASAGAVGQGTVRGLTTLVTALAVNTPPLTLVFDDWQWADDASHQVLSRIVRDCSNKPILVLLTAGNPDQVELPITDVRSVELQALTMEQSREAIKALVPTALDLGVTAKLHALSGGNPLFLEELSRALPISCTSEDVDSLVKGPSGPSTQELIQRRVDQLPAAHRKLLQEASVIGVEFPAWLLKRANKRRNVERALRSLTAGDLIYPVQDDSFRFKHGIARVVVYNSISPASRKRKLHSLVARALEERFQDRIPEYCEQLAYHYAESGNAPEKASSYGQQAGDKAAATSSPDRARQQYRSTLTVLETLTPGRNVRREWLQVCAKWAAACVYSPAPEQLSVLRKAVQYAAELEDATAGAHAHYWLGWIHYALGDQAQAMHHHHTALAVAERTKLERLTTQLLLNLGQSHAAAGAYPEAIEFLSLGLERNRKSRTDTSRIVPVGYVYALGCKALVHGDIGEFDLAKSTLQEALDRVADTEHPIRGSLLCLLGMIQLWQGLWKDCAETSARIRRNAERVVGPYVFAMGRILGACAQWMLTSSTDAIREFRDTADWLDARSIRLYLSFNYGFLADALAWSGQIQLARDYAEKALARAGERDPIGLSMSHRVLARTCSDGSPVVASAARNHLDQAIRSAHARGSNRDVALGYLERGKLLARGGQTTSARHSLRRSLDAFERMGMPWHSEQAKQVLRALLNQDP